MKRYFISPQQKGFTLIELLVVIAIIGVLAGLLLVNLIGIRQRARDAQRKSDLRQIQSAIELYRADSGSYPTSLVACGQPLIGSGSTPTTYMQKLPCDALTNVTYTYTSDGTTYSIIACLENSNDSQRDSTNIAPCNGSTSFSFTVKNP
jgi:general secretion pathway protein G